MNIRLRILPWFSNLIKGEKSGELSLDFFLTEGSTFQDFLRVLTSQRSDIAALFCDQADGQVKYNAVIVINDRVIELVGGYQALLSDGDVIMVMPAYSGG